MAVTYLEYQTDSTSILPAVTGRFLAHNQLSIVEKTFLSYVADLMVDGATQDHKTKEK